MKEKAIVIIEIEKSERIYRFEMPLGAPLGEAYDAAFEILQKIVKHAQDASEKAKRADTTEVVS